MKNKLYYVLFPVYVLVVIFILYVNGVFTGAAGSQAVSPVNLAINIGFLLIIGVLFIISAVSFGRLNRVTGELEDTAQRMQKEYREAGGRNLWAKYQNRQDVFTDKALQDAFQKYRLRVAGLRNGRGTAEPCDLEEYINDSLLERAGMHFFNAGISGALTGIGILGTFLGLSMGLGAFSGDDIYTISDNVGPLLSGMKVAFHTSVYGIFFSLIFNIVYRSIMADAYEKLENFLNVFRQTAQPQTAGKDSDTAAMVMYQAGMAGALKQILDLMQGSASEQTAGVERIVDQCMRHLQNTMDTDFRRLGNTLKAAGEAQAASAASSREMTEILRNLTELSRSVQVSLEEIMDRQEIFSRELMQQKEKLADACGEMRNDINGQLYALERMRSRYEK